MKLDWSPRALLLALVLVWWGLHVRADSPRWELGLGEFNATELESQECYFSLGQSTMVTFHPKSEYCTVARNELKGKRGRLVFLVEP